METEESIDFVVVNPHDAGIDIGSRDIFVSVDGKQCVSFKTCTEDYERCCKCLIEKWIRSVGGNFN
ncbi:MAG: hypothetical protein LBF05_06240 [Tannerella sp.]|jgi:hypothetical protein|nr:hypothetical protein [Tannerella sp.]